MRHAAVLLPALLAATTVTAAPPCATPEQARAVGALYAAAPQPPPFMAAAKLELPESVVASALPGTLARGAAGSAFATVWASLGTWDKATTLIRQGGHVFEVASRIPAGAPSDRPGSKFFNLTSGPGLNGHLRPDLVGAIYALRLEGPEGPLRGVVVLDLAGESVFGVFTGEGRDQPPAVLAQFEQTWALFATLPPACAAG
jgi:putative heme iron utilization protein